MLFTPHPTSLRLPPPSPPRSLLIRYVLTATSPLVCVNDRTSRFGTFPQLIVGHHKGFPIKRILIQFDVSGGPAQAVESATLQLWFLYAHKASWMQEDQVERQLNVHRMLVPWKEMEATSSMRASGKPWPANYIADDSVVDQEATDAWTITPGTKKHWSHFDITRDVNTWIRDPKSNHGLLIWAVNEAETGRDLRFASSNDKNPAVRPRLVIKYKKDGASSVSTTHASTTATTEPASTTATTVTATSDATFTTEDVKTTKLVKSTTRTQPIEWVV